MIKSYELKLPKRKAVISIEELPDQIKIRVRFSKYGIMGDELEFMKLSAPIFGKYDSDSRPTVLVNDLNGESATIFGDENSSIALVPINPGPLN